MDLKARIGKAIRDARTAKGMSVNELSKKIKIGANTIYRYESGRYLAPTKTIESIAKALDVQADVIFKPR